VVREHERQLSNGTARTILDGEAIGLRPFQISFRAQTFEIA
jgi:hypothetical protein